MDACCCYVFLGKHPLEGVFGLGVALLCCHIKLLCRHRLYSKGSVCARSVSRSVEIQSWQRDKSQIECEYDMNKDKGTRGEEE